MRSVPGGHAGTSPAGTPARLYMAFGISATSACRGGPMWPPAAARQGDEAGIGVAEGCIKSIVSIMSIVLPTRKRGCVVIRVLRRSLLF